MVVGLGNPGAQYANTRHNVGHMLIDLLAHNAGVQLSSHRSGTHCADIRLGMLPGGIPGPRVIVATSDSYMNTSGGEGGHNGLKSISQVLGTKDYNRLRIGIGRPPGRMNPADYVLARMNGSELDDLAVTIAQAGDVVEDIVTTSFSEAQQRLHTRQGA